MTDAILAVANRQQGDTLPIDPPPQQQAQPAKTKPPVTPATDPAEEPFFWPEIRQIIEEHLANQPRELQREIGPSELGTDCVHCLAAKLAGWPERSQPGWLPFIGTCVHAHFENMFRQLNNEPAFQFPYTSEDNVTELVERWRSEYRVTVGRLQGLHAGYEMKGSIDLWDRKTHSTIDWKVVGNTTVTKVRAHGPSQQYRVQASLYGIGLRNEGEQVERNCIYFLPRNKTSLGDALPWETRFDPKPGMWALARAQLLVNLMDCVEQECGPEVRDSWIRQLPAAGPDKCFSCKGAAWPDSTTLPEFDSKPWPDVPAKWLKLIPLVEPEYEFTE
ncbi:hypothetical protein BLI708_00250 [Bifidobacterium imperatoris]|nr:hypothetical protein [Bifidobacterium imperatoris]QSY58715.1 hypothetical protein BLI708_00250 [Bifidobacterium imperatoris]